jgi:hypothetical protein
MVDRRLLLIDQHVGDLRVAVLRGGEMRRRCRCGGVVAWLALLVLGLLTPLLQLQPRTTAASPSASISVVDDVYVRVLRGVLCDTAVAPARLDQHAHDEHQGIFLMSAASHPESPSPSSSRT